MNRHERRAAAKERGRVIYIDFGRLQERNPNYGAPVECYVCGAPHEARSLARITDDGAVTHVALCEAHASPPSDAIMRKHCNAPALKIYEGGEATTEQVEALADKSGATEH